MQFVAQDALVGADEARVVLTFGTDASGGKEPGAADRSSQRLTLRARGVTPSVSVGWDGEAVAIANDGNVGIEAAVWAEGAPGYNVVPISVNELGASDFAPDFQSWDRQMRFRLPFTLQLPSSSVGEITLGVLSVQAGLVSVRISGIQFSIEPIILLAEEPGMEHTVREAPQSLRLNSTPVR